MAQGIPQQLFTANFHGRRINCDSIHRHGNSYVAHHGPDYFKSDDPWFRGIEMLYGPDGGVFLLDWSDIGECHENDGIHRTSGRIYKLTFGEPKAQPSIDFRKMRSAELIEMLAHENEYFARQARLQIPKLGRGIRTLPSTVSPEDRKGLAEATTAAAAMLGQKLQAAFESENDIKRQLRLMWARYSFEPLASESFLLGQLDHSNEHIRSWAVRLLADGQIELSNKTQTVISKMANDDSGLVRLYVASSIPRLSPDVALQTIRQLARKSSDINDRVQPKLIWYGLEPILAKHLGLEHNGSPVGIDLIETSRMPLLRKNIARRLTHEIENHPGLVEKLLALVERSGERPELQHDILQGMSLALNGWSQVTKPEKWNSISERLRKQNNELAELVQELDLVFGDGRALEDLKKIANDNSADLAIRRKAFVSLFQVNRGTSVVRALQKTS